jgi:hypothetical protein
MGGWTRGLLECVSLTIPLNRSLSDAQTFSDLRSLSLSGLPIARVLLRACVPALMLAYLFTGLPRSYLPTGVPFKSPYVPANSYIHTCYHTCYCYYAPFSYSSPSHLGGLERTCRQCGQAQVEHTGAGR